jgi:hypothetical protein
MGLGATMTVGADGVAIITIENGKVNAMHPTGVSLDMYNSLRHF